MIRGVTYDREDTCPDCRRKRSLDLFDRNNRPAYFPMLLDRNEINRLYSRPFYYMKCKSCGKEFRIDWGCEENKIPVPLTEEKLENFLQDYINSYENPS